MTLLSVFEDFVQKVPHGVINNRWKILNVNPNLRGYDGEANSYIDLADRDYQRKYRYFTFTTPEYKSVSGLQTDPKWEMCRGVGNSFGFNNQEEELSHGDSRS